MRACLHRLWLVFFMGFVLLSSPTRAAPATAPTTQPVLVEVRKIWDGAPHNAFTDLVRFRDRWYCAFREGEAHVSPDGALRVIRSDDGEKWVSVARITSDRGDLRDAKLSVTPDGRLMLSGAVALAKPQDDARHQSMVWFSADGETFDAGHDVGDVGFWVWRQTWHPDGTCYAIGYRTSGNRFVRLYASRDGVKMEPRVPTLFDDGDPGEHGLVFLPDGTAVCLLRRDPITDKKAAPTAQLGLAKPPYTEWTWKDLGVRIGGPQLIRLPDGRLLAAVRLYTPKARTALCWLDADAGTLTEALALPSGGDTSYCGLVMHEGLLWVSYYSSHTRRTSIYLAKVKLPATK